MGIKTATEIDIHIIQKLAEDIWMKHYPPIIGEEQTTYMLHKMYSAEALQKQMEEGLDFYLWFENDIPIAFAGIDYTTKPYGFLSKLYLDDKFRGKGIAQNFLSELETIFMKNGKFEVQLTVNRQNIGAINFYFKSDFKILRCEDFDIGNGYFMNDFVMVKDLSKIPY